MKTFLKVNKLSKKCKNIYLHSYKNEITKTDVLFPAK